MFPTVKTKVEAQGVVRPPTREGLQAEIAVLAARGTNPDKLAALEAALEALDGQ